MSARCAIWLAAFITAVYVGFIVGIGALVGTRGDVLLSAVAAALVAMAFQPVRRRAQRFANRLVYGERASPYEVLSSFSQRVASAYAADDVLERMARLLGEGTGASRAEVWVRVGRRLQRSAAWPAADAPVSVALADGELPSIEGASLAMPVRDEGICSARSSSRSRRRIPSRRPRSGSSRTSRTRPGSCYATRR